MTPTLLQANRIARDNLSACFTSVGFVAGTHHFVDLLARDSLFATLGANTIGETSASKQTIKTFLAHQRADGLIPFLILRSRHNAGKYFGRHTYLKIPKPQFRSHQSGGLVPDGGLMTIIAARAYAEVTNDDIFLKQQYPKLRAALGWYTQKFGEGLIREWFLCEWADAVLKAGKTLYTNVLYYKAVGDLSWISARLKKSDDAKAHARVQERLGETIRREFWNGRYFADWIDFRRQNYFASHANMLAIAFGLTSSKESASILTFADRYCWNDGMLNNSYPTYPWWRIPMIQRLAGVPDYHNGCVWLQPGIIFALTLYQSGRTKRAREVIDSIAQRILRYNGVHEVYEKNGIPVQRLLYRAEHPFAWSAGLFLWASAILGNSV